MLDLVIEYSLNEFQELQINLFVTFKYIIERFLNTDISQIKQSN
jgi:hypothetical protein